jgi:hypothetical protein
VNHRSYVLRSYVRHRIPANRRLHLVTHTIAWLALVTLLSQIPLPTLAPHAVANVGTLFVALSCGYWLWFDGALAAAVAMLTWAWASALWGAGYGQSHGWLAGVLAPSLVLAAVGLVNRYADVYHHEHAPFLKGETKLRAALYAAHLSLWGIFHSAIALLLQAGWRPAMKATLDEEARRALRVRERVPWANWAQIASCRAQLVSAPGTVEELAAAVREARARGLRVRVVGSGFSWSSLAASDEALIFCERLDRITVDSSSSQTPFVWAEAGVTNRQLNAVLAAAHLCMPWNVVLETVRVAGIVTSGTHGTGKATATVGDLVEAFEIIDAAGERRILSDATVGSDVMSAARLGLGLFGVIARVQLRVVPLLRVRQTDLRLPVGPLLATLPALIAAHDSVELYWFPFNRDAWVRTIDRTEEPCTRHGNGLTFRAQNFLQNGAAIIFFMGVARLLPSLTPLLLRIGMSMLPFRSRVMNLPDSHHYRHWIEMMPAGCMEVGFKVDSDYANVRRAWQVTEEIVAEYARRGLYPLNLTLNVRFIGQSSALLTPAHGEGLTCYVEIMWMGRPRGWAELSSALCHEWLKVPGALPHWSKEFEHVDGIVPIVRAHLGERRERFLEALARTGIDPTRMFWNPMVQRALGGAP